MLGSVIIFIVIRRQLNILSCSFPERGCPAAIVRVWPDLDNIPIELCGENLSDDETLIISKSSVMRISFLTANRAVGSKGFEGIWTEIQDSKW